MVKDGFDAAEQATLVELSRKKQKFERERDELAQRLEKAEAKIIEVQAQYGAIYNKRATLLSLPTEVTCLIFEYALMDSEDSPVDEDGEPTRVLMEVIISHVCHLWRVVSLGFPNLWTTFCYEGPQATRVPLDRFDAYMKRSAAQPLELWLEFRDAGEDRDHLPLLEKAIAHVARWKRVTLLSDSNTPILELIPKLETLCAPNLEHFAMCPDLDCECESADIEQLLIDTLEPKVLQGGAPKLKSVWMDGSSAWTCMPPLSNITTLRIEVAGAAMTHKFTWPAFSTVLSLPYLRDLSLLGDAFNLVDFDFSTVGLIYMNSLKNLRFSDTNGFCGLLPSIRAPLLETLIIQNCLIQVMVGNHTSHPYSFPSLRDFFVVETTVSSEFSIPENVAKMTSAATHILISHENMDESFLVTINNDLFDKKVWPRLKTLSCNIEGITEIEPYLTFAKSRPENSFILRVHKDLVESWKEDEAGPLNSLKNICTIEELDEENPIVDDCWPPGDDIFAEGHLIDDQDPFEIESFY